MIYPPLPLLSSTAPDLYTWMEVQLPRADGDVPVTDEIVRVLPPKREE